MVSKLVKTLQCLIKSVPKSLLLWEQLGRRDPQRAVAEANYQAIRPGLSHSELINRSRALPWMVYWLMLYGHSPPLDKPRIDPFSALPGTDEAWSVATQHKGVKNLLSQVQFGLRGYECKDKLIRLPYCGHPELALLDGCLRLRKGLGSADSPPNPHLRPLVTYTESSKAPTSWFRAPHHIQNAARQAISYVKRHIPPYLDLAISTPIGVTLGELAEYWHELSAISLYDFWVMQGIRSPSRVVHGRRKFVAHMAEATGISQEAADVITKRLTMSHSYVSTSNSAAFHNPQLTPLVQVEGGLFPLTALLAPSIPPQDIMKMLQVAYSGKSFRELGRKLGKAGENQVAALLKKKLHADVLIKTNVLTYKGRRQWPDLDVVVYVPGDMLVMIQVKWHIMINNQHEALTQQEHARKDRLDLEDLREEIKAGRVQVQWPSDWGDVDADRCERRWFVLLHDTMPVHNLGDSDIQIRSYLLIEQLLSGHTHSVRDLVNLLDRPPMPAVGQPNWQTVNYGEWTIEAEEPNIHRNQPEPFDDLPGIALNRNIGLPPPSG